MYINSKFVSIKFEGVRDKFENKLHKTERFIFH